MKLNKYSCSVLLAGFCWGFIGFFSRNLTTFGIDSKGAIVLRCGIATIFFGVLLLLTNKKGLMIKIRDIWCFIGSGCFSLLLFTYCYFNAIELIGLSSSAILLYIAPSIVVLISALLFKEKITKIKLLAVMLSFIGCALVSGISSGFNLNLNGLLYGVFSGIGYALYTIFSRFALQKGYNSNTINFYSCLFAALGASIIWPMKEPVVCCFSSFSVFFWCIGLGGFSCFLPYMLYTYGLTGLENGKASVLSSVEPVVASLVGIFLFNEDLTITLLLGITFVLLAIVLLNINPKKTVKLGKKKGK